MDIVGCHKQLIQNGGSQTSTNMVSTPSTPPQNVWNKNNQNLKDSLKIDQIKKEQNILSAKVANIHINKRLYLNENKNIPIEKGDQAILLDIYRQIKNKGIQVDAITYNSQGNFVSIRTKNEKDLERLTAAQITVAKGVKKSFVPKQSQALLITIEPDFDIPDSEIKRVLSTHGTIVGPIQHQYLTLDGDKIKTSKRKIFMKPNKEVKDIPHSVVLCGVRTHLFYKGKHTWCYTCKQKQPHEHTCKEPTEEEGGDTHNTAELTENPNSAEINFIKDGVNINKRNTTSDDKAVEEEHIETTSTTTAVEEENMEHEKQQIETTSTTTAVEEENMELEKQQIETTSTTTKKDEPKFSRSTEKRYKVQNKTIESYERTRKVRTRSLLDPNQITIARERYNYMIDRCHEPIGMPERIDAPTDTRTEENERKMKQKEKYDQQFPANLSSPALG